MKRTTLKLLLAFCALICPPAAFSQEGNFATILLSGGGMPIPGVRVAVCSTGLTTTAASVTNNIATLTMSSNPITAGFLATKTLTVSGFTGGDTYYNGTFTIAAVGATTISYALTHANAAAGTNGKAFQTGDATTACAPLSSLFTDDTGSTAAANPTTSDSIGNVSVWAPAGLPYQVQYYGSNIATKVVEMSIGSTNLASTFTSLTVTGTATFSGLLNASGGGTVSLTSINNIKFCENFVGSDASAKIQACINALPAAGGIADAHNLTDAGGTGSTIIDPGARSVTLLLGPYTYQIQQLVLETNFHVVGAGDGSYSASSTSTTVLQACATCAATNTVVLGTNGGNGGPVQHASMEGLRIYGATADTAIGMNLKTVNGANTGIWYSKFSNLCVGTCGPSGASANGFSGGAIVLDATAANTINQFLEFHNVFASKTNGGGSALSLIGTNGQITFTDSCEFDGTTRNDGTNVVNIANSAGNGGPYSITFVGATVQHGTVGVNIAGAFSLTFIDTHFENVGGGFLMNTGAGSEISAGITIIGSTCQNACGNNTGAGYFAKTTTPNTVSVKFIGNQIQNSVDANYVGFTNIQNFISIGDESDTLTTTVPLPNLFGQQITYKTGSGAGDYTTTSTNYVAVDGANLIASIFIPTGWKLVVSASGAIQSDTAAAQVFTAIADGATPVVVNTSLASAISLPVNFALNTVIAGNGATHSIDLRFKTAAGADAAHILNSAGNGIPQMVLTLMPSN